MCVIAYKAKDVRFPSDENIRKMWEKNPDGAGIMWRDEDGLIHFEKGFMKLKSFEDWIKRNKSWLENVECALHFRITTHGGTCQGNCHPFIIENGANQHSLSGAHSRMLMHNGILPLIPRSKDISDSAELAIRLGDYENPKDVMSIMNEMFKGNRIIMMDESGTHFFGDEFKPSTKKDNEGILYSNLNWEYSRSSFGFSCSTSAKYPNGVWDYDLFWDEDDKTWRDSCSGYKVPFEQVDPYEISYEDMEIWDMQADADEEMREICKAFGISKQEYFDLKTEAESQGLDVLEYIESMYKEEYAMG